MLNFQMESPTRIDDVTIISSGIKNVSNSFQFYADGASDARFQLPTGWLPNAIPPSAKCEPAVCQMRARRLPIGGQRRQPFFILR